jgi:hypothetical protein
MTPALREASRRAVQVVTDRGEILSAGRASLFVFEQLGYRRTARILRIAPFVWAVELGYQLVAKNRPFFSRFLFRQER